VGSWTDLVGVGSRINPFFPASRNAFDHLYTTSGFSDLFDDVLRQQQLDFWTSKQEALYAVAIGYMCPTLADGKHCTSATEMEHVVNLNRSV